MFALKFSKFFLIVVLAASACRLWQPKPDANAAPPPTVAVENSKSAIPFATKEPETFQAEIVVTANGGVAETIFTARSGANRLTIYGFQTNDELALLQTGAGANYLIAPRQKIYAENQPGGGIEADEIFPTAELLNQTPTAVFEKLGAENNLTKYRVASAASEIVVTVDENIKLPVKQEFYSVAGGQKTLTSTTELKNFQPQTDAGNFELPKDYRKVSPTEWQEIRRRERTK